MTPKIKYFVFTLTLITLTNSLAYAQPCVSTLTAAETEESKAQFARQGEFLFEKFNALPPFNSLTPNALEKLSNGLRKVLAFYEPGKVLRITINTMRQFAGNNEHSNRSASYIDIHNSRRIERALTRVGIKFKLQQVRGHHYFSSIRAVVTTERQLLNLLRILHLPEAYYAKRTLPGIDKYDYLETKAEVFADPFYR